MYVNEFVGGFEFEARPEHERRRALHPPRHPARARGRAAVSRSSRSTSGFRARSSVDYMLTNPGPEHAGARRSRRAASRSRSTTTTRSSSPPTSGSRTTGRCRRRIAGRGCAGPSRASSATTTGSRIRGSRRSSTSRPTIRATRRSACRSSAISGDIRYLGALGQGPLPLDRPHQVKVFGNYTFDMGLNLGLGFLTTSGKPLTALAANPSTTAPARFP